MFLLGGLLSMLPLIGFFARPVLWLGAFLLALGFLVTRHDTPWDRGVSGLCALAAIALSLWPLFG